MTDHTDYKEMYLKMVRASEKSINTLIKAQQACEEIYITTRQPKHKVVVRKATPKS